MSRPLPYVPMVKPEPLATQDDHVRMAAILAKHAQPKVEIRNQAAAAPSDAEQSAPVASGSLPNTFATPSKLQWLKPTDPLTSLLYTACGRYRCRRTNYTGTRRYHLEKLVESLWFYEMGKPMDTFAQAQQRAQADSGHL